MVPDSAPMPWGAPPPPPPPRKDGGKNQTSMPPGRMWLVSNNYVTPGFFASLALPVARGRDFTDDDGTRGKKVAIVNETLAKRAFGEADPIGRRVAWAGSDAYDIEIVGVVRDLRSEHLRTSAPDAIFFPLAQAPFAGSRTPTTAGGRESMDLTVLLRARPGARLRGERLVQHLRAFDSRMFVEDVWTFDDEAGRLLSQERLLAASGWVLGAIALALLIVGLYGTLTAAVARGRRELGIRLALGASPRSIGGTVVARAVAVAATGLALGLPLSYAFMRSFAHLLYGVKPIEPLVVAVTIAVVLATAALAAYVPARRASRVDPLIALRSE
jgi:putative ABC transport system permease protein